MYSVFNQNEKEETGPGSEQEQKSELVANEDNQGQAEDRDGQKKEEQTEEDGEKDKINDKEIFDEVCWDQISIWIFRKLWYFSNIIQFSIELLRYVIVRFLCPRPERSTWGI